jgi:hypothetical protein
MQFKARADFKLKFKTSSLKTGSDPGKPRHTGQTCEFGSLPNFVEQPQNILDFV